jgi:hypothetical protein
MSELLKPDPTFDDICQRCGYMWRRINPQLEPVTCPNCRSAYYKRPRKDATEPPSRRAWTDKLERKLNGLGIMLQQISWMWEGQTDDDAKTEDRGADNATAILEPISRAGDRVPEQGVGEAKGIVERIEEKIEQAHTVVNEEAESVMFPNVTIDELIVKTNEHHMPDVHHIDQVAVDPTEASLLPPPPGMALTYRRRNE